MLASSAAQACQNGAGRFATVTLSACRQARRASSDSVAAAGAGTTAAPAAQEARSSSTITSNAGEANWSTRSPGPSP